MLLRRSFVSQRTGRYNRREAGLRFAQQQNIDVSLRGEPDKVLLLVGSALTQHACMLSSRGKRSPHILTPKKQRSEQLLQRIIPHKIPSLFHRDSITPCQALASHL